MSHRIEFVTICALILVGGLPGTVLPEEPTGGSEDQPRESGLVEHAERRLIQLDISLFPKKKKADAELPELRPDDLELTLNHKPVDIRHIDRICNADETAPPETVATSSVVAPTERTQVGVPTGDGTYLFYFEHSHLTMEGQQNALVMTAEMILELIRGGARGMIVSSGHRVRQSELTDDPDELFEFLASVRRDYQQWGEVAYAEGEQLRYADVFDHQSYGNARWQALLYAREERIRTNRQLRRFSAVLGLLANADPPKAVLYFADIIRKNPGQHYESLFSNIQRSPVFQKRLDELAIIIHDAYTGGLSFDRVTGQAAANGIRLYTIRARGLEVGFSTLERSHDQQVNQMPEPYRPMQDADETMIGLAQETGGASFRGGTESSTIDKVLDRVRSDLSCFYIVSFSSKGLRTDSLLSIFVRFNEESPRYDELDRGWNVRNRGQLMVQSEAKRKESILLAAHTTPDSMESEIGRSMMIPLGFLDNEYQALAQFAIESLDLPVELSSSTTWDLGMSLVSGDKVPHSTSRRLEVSSAGIPVVLEAAWSFRPGPSELVSVGYEHRFGQLAVIDVDADWPDPDSRAASITPIAVVQPADGVFLRAEPSGEDERRNQGSLAIGDGPAQLDRPIYFISLVCRNKQRRDLWIDRKLVGNVEVDFELQSWDGEGGDRCVQIRDLINGGQAGWGDFRYEVRVYADASLEGEALAERVRDFTGL